jgi:hypothetical protein
MADEYKDVIRVHDDDADFTGTRLKDKMFGFAPDTNKFIARVGSAYKKAATEGTDTFYNQLSVGYSATPLTREKLDINGAIIVGEATDENDGTIQYTNDEFSFREDGAWKTLGTALYNSLTDRPSLITHSPTGFLEPYTDVSYDATERKWTIVSGAESVQDNVSTGLTDGYISAAHSTGNGIKWLWYDNGIQQGTSFPGFDKCLIAAAVVWDGVKFGIRETHLAKRWGTDHQQSHRNDGTYKMQAGGDLTGFVLDSATTANRTVNISEFTIWDEENPTVIPAWNKSAGYTRGAVNGSNLIITTAETEMIANNGSGRPYYYDNGTETLMSNGYHGTVLAVAIPVTSDVGSQLYRIVLIQPQKQFATVEQARAIISTSDINLYQYSDLIQEIVVIGQFIFGYAGTDFVLDEANKVWGSRYKQASGISSVNSTVVDQVTIVGAGTAVSPYNVGVDYRSKWARITGGISAFGKNVEISSDKQFSFDDEGSTVGFVGFGNGIQLDGVLLNKDYLQITPSSGNILKAGLVSTRFEVSSLFDGALASFIKYPKTGILDFDFSHGINIPTDQTYKINGAPLSAANVGAEAALGNPSTTGQVLTSTNAGVRSWSADLASKWGKGGTGLNEVYWINGITPPVTTSAGNYRQVFFGASSVFFDRSTGTEFSIGSNYWWNGSSRYRVDGASLLLQAAAATGYRFYYAASGLAGATMTLVEQFRMGTSGTSLGCFYMREVGTAPSALASNTGIYADTSGNLWSLGTAGTRLLNAWQGSLTAGLRQYTIENNVGTTAQSVFLKNTSNGAGCYNDFAIQASDRIALFGAAGTSYSDAQYAGRAFIYCNNIPFRIITNGVTRLDILQEGSMTLFNNTAAIATPTHPLVLPNPIGRISQHQIALRQRRQDVAAIPAKQRGIADDHGLRHTAPPIRASQPGTDTDAATSSGSPL